MGTSHRTMLLLAFLFSAGCAHMESNWRETTPPNRALDSHVMTLVNQVGREPGQSVRECDTLDCMATAERECSAAHLTRAFFTVEGTPAFIDYFVRKDQSSKRGCSILVVADYTQDYWGRCTVKKKTCPTLADATAEEVPVPVCSEPEVLMKVEPCERPK